MTRILIRKASNKEAKVQKDLRVLWNNYRPIKQPKSFQPVNENRSGFTFVAVDTDSGMILGSCGFFGEVRRMTKHRGEIGCGTHPNHRGRGVATKLMKAVLDEAKKRSFKRAEAETSVKNAASVRLLKRCGFKLEGRKKDGLRLDNGKYLDSYIFGKILN